MELPVTPKPMPASSPNLPTDHTGKLFGIVYITLTRVIDTLIPVCGGEVLFLPFQVSTSLVVGSARKNLGQVIPENNRLAIHNWFPDI
ncbi:hypothetical protein DSO57_1000435 [Entomophthora muscae]|uniref:Uncharacterized protein n=1 Tax=Entomophthora muscae TaxID=34485 RepID=A0ACC2UIE0_9FUNG|nr:hypothetical protein DSO57_1000435 [Entomophthora muscae]